MDKLEIFDHSMLDLFRLCPVKFYYRMLLDLTLIGDLNYVPAFGGAGHEGLAAWYRTGSAEKMDKAFIDYWSPYEGQDLTQKRTMMRGLMIMKQYRERYTNEPFTFESPDYIEVGFAMELGDFIICGKLDGICNYNLGFDAIIVLEHKFSNSKGYLTINPNQQIDTYIWGATKTLGKVVMGAYFNQIYHINKKITGNEFIRELTRRTPQDLENWERDTLYWIRQVNNCIEDDFFPRNSKNCGAFFRACEYKKLCTARTKPEYESLIEVLYEETPWSPYPDARKFSSDDSSSLFLSTGVGDTKGEEASGGFVIKPKGDQL